MPPRQRFPNGLRKPKGKPRGISKLRILDPTIPNPLTPFQMKKGETLNPGGRSKAITVSNALRDVLTFKPDGALTQAGMLAQNLVNRAMNDSVELERVIEITEPEVFKRASGDVQFGLKTEDVSVVFSKLMKDT